MSQMLLGILAGGPPFDGDLGFDLADSIKGIGCPILRVLCEGWESEMPGSECRNHAADSRNEIFVQPSFTRTGPASSKR